MCILVCVCVCMCVCACYIYYTPCLQSVQILEEYIRCISEARWQEHLSVFGVKK